MRVAIVGGGVIGGGWAARFVLNGHDVALHDPDPEAPAKLEAVLAEARRALPMLYDVALPTEGTLTHHDTVEAACAGAAWVQESVPERLDLKHAVLSRIRAATDAPVGSSTSGFKPTDLARGDARVMVAHPFNPVYLLPLVELVGGEATDPAALDFAETLLTSIGMAPLRVRAEIDAHIADRFLEAVWREALWLVKDGVATTREIDEAIRLGFGLRWAQMGLFETYRLAGGAGGMAHFIRQFGPALQWPWTKLMDVPELDEALVARIAAQSDAQSGDVSIPELARRRDDNLVTILRGLKARGTAAGKVVADHEAGLHPAYDASAVPMETQRRTVPIDWTDYNGHMNESRYGQAFSDAGDSVLMAIGCGPGYPAERNLSWFTAYSNVTYHQETMAGQRIVCLTRVTEGRGKKLAMSHSMEDEEGTVLATCEQLLIHVDLATRKSSEPPEDIAARLRAIAEAHA